MNRIRFTLMVLGLCLYQLACNNYGLDDRIRAALNNNGGSSTDAIMLTNVQGGTYSNNTITYTLSNFTKFTATASYNGATGGMTVDAGSVPSFLGVTISAAGALQISTRSQPSTLPTTLASGSLNPNIRFVLSSGTSVALPMNILLKRAFVSSTMVTEDLAFAGTFVAGCSGTQIDKVNCGCRNRALAAGLTNAAKFRAWLSYDGGSPVTAACNIAQKATGPNLSIGAVLITNPGSGYTSAPAITFGGCGGATGQVSTATVLNGQITDVTITNPGTCPTATPSTASASGGGGTGAILTSIRGACNIKTGDGGPWYTTQSLPQLIAYDMGAQGNGSLLNVNALVTPINFTEFGNASNSTPYTGTNGSGEYLTANCTQWTAVATNCGQVGSSSSITGTWTSSTTSGLAATGVQNTFYCFETD